MEKWAPNLNRQLHRRSDTDDNKYMKRCSTSYVIRGMRIETTMRYDCAPIRIDKIPEH